MAESFFLTHSLKTVRARVLKESFCDPAQSTFVITVRKIRYLPAFSITTVSMCALISSERQKFWVWTLSTANSPALKLVYDFTVSSPTGHVTPGLCYYSGRLWSEASWDPGDRARGRGQRKWPPCRAGPALWPNIQSPKWGSSFRLGDIM